MDGKAPMRTLVGFGFGAIQTGLFLWEAQQSKNFDRLVVAIPNEEVVCGLRRNNGDFLINIATHVAREVGEIRRVEILNPTVARDREAIVEAISDASEMATALPSVAAYEEPKSGIARLIAEGLLRKLRRPAPATCVLYAAENNNHAAEILFQSICRHLPEDEVAPLRNIFQPLDTVIGKMSRVVRDQDEIRETGLRAYVDGGSRAYLVESFNRILVSRVRLPAHVCGITSFVEKDDLLPFEEAKLYGHNAAHALLGFIARQRGHLFIADAANDIGLIEMVRSAFLEESGNALIARRGGVDPLFTVEGYRAYVDDLMERMVNPWLRDDVERVTRDSRRKLGWDDRFIGTMRIALAAGIRPIRFAAGAAAALRVLSDENPNQTQPELIDEIWSSVKGNDGEKARLRALVLETGPISGLSNAGTGRSHAGPI